MKRYRTVPAVAAPKRPSFALKLGWFCLVVGALLLLVDERNVLFAVPLAVVIAISGIVAMLKGRIAAGVGLLIATAVAFPLAFLLSAMLSSTR